jgi:hypothetical protein
MKHSYKHINTIEDRLIKKVDEKKIMNIFVKKTSSLEEKYDKKLEDMKNLLEKYKTHSDKHGDELNRKM